MKNIKLVAVLVICSVILCSCGKTQKEYEYTELTVREQGAPYSDWDKSTTGSVKYLDGSTVFVSIFLEDKDSLWTDVDRELVMNSMDVACEFLVDEGKRYGKEVNLIYDISEHEDLEYHFEYDKSFPGSTSVSDNIDAVDDLIYGTYDYIETNIPTQEIMEKYQVNSIGYLIFIDGEAGAATAYPHHFDGNTYYEEIAFINLRWTSGLAVYPYTYAHEMLHLFGARDLYYTSRAKGISREFVDYIADNYSDEIMLGSSAKAIGKKDSITQEISKITAYFIGWRGYVSELETFPSIKMTEAASFCDVENPEGNYDDYELSARVVSEEDYKRIIVYKIADIIFLIGIFVSVIRGIIRRKKYRDRINSNYSSEQF